MCSPPVISQLANLSFECGNFPSSNKRARMLLLLLKQKKKKKAGVESTSSGNYRPISNRSTVSMVPERLALARPLLVNLANFSQYQSAYRTGYSTGTAGLGVFHGVYTAADNKQISVLIGLDLSAAFDTVVDHSTLIERLRSEFGVADAALDWLCSYLGDRTLYVKMGLIILTLSSWTSAYCIGRYLTSCRWRCIQVRSR